MMANVAKLANAPVLLTTLPEHADAQWLLDAYARNLELSRAEAEPVYWVMDVRAASATYADGVKGWLKIAQGLGGASVAPTLKVVFAAESHMMAFFDQSKLTAFTLLEDAVAFAADAVASHALSA